MHQACTARANLSTRPGPHGPNSLMMAPGVAPAFHNVLQPTRESHTLAGAEVHAMYRTLSLRWTQARQTMRRMLSGGRQSAACTRCGEVITISGIRHTWTGETAALATSRGPWPTQVPATRPAAEPACSQSISQTWRLCSDQTVMPAVAVR